MARLIPALVLCMSVGALTWPTGAATPAETIVHALNRLGYGPRAGDVERVQRMGLSNYFEAQLHPDRIADPDLAAHLRPLVTIGLSSREISGRYEQPVLEQRRRQRQSGDTPAAEASELRRMASARRDANLPMLELSQQKILRAVYSERQLEEVLVDFWFNHFNVDARKGPSRYLLTEYEREAIRPHVLGHFRDLLGATAKSPAMLFYLDNWMSADPEGASLDRARNALAVRGRTGQRRSNPRPLTPEQQQRLMQQRPNMPRGLNENYARELMELHTLGVDAGYTQRDVTEVARAFTGWTIDGPRQGGSFRFAAALHDDKEKVVLGHRFAPGGGRRDGERVLDLLAAHPSTATFISTKLARRFVSDTPPPALIARAAETFRRTDGDLRAVMTTLVNSPEFLSLDSTRAKVKTPFEFVVSAVRALGADVTDATPLVRALQDLGMPLYQCQPPTGYKDTADAWVNTGALVARMNLAQTLAGGRTRGVMVGELAEATTLIGGEISETTRSTIARATTPAQAAALALGSPEFQRR